MSLEDSGEMSLIVITHTVCHLSDVDLSLLKQSGSLFHTDISQEVTRCQASDFLYAAM